MVDDVLGGGVVGAVVKCVISLYPPLFTLSLTTSNPCTPSKSII